MLGKLVTDGKCSNFIENNNLIIQLTFNIFLQNLLKIHQLMINGARVSLHQ